MLGPVHSVRCCFRFFFNPFIGGMSVCVDRMSIGVDCAFHFGRDRGKYYGERCRLVRTSVAFVSLFNVHVEWKLIGINPLTSNNRRAATRVPLGGDFVTLLIAL